VKFATNQALSLRQVQVHKKPKVALLSTGDELIDLHGDQLQNETSFSGIYDTNRPSLLALLQGLGYEVIDLGIAPDT
jgi:gephyrin